MYLYMCKCEVNCCYKTRAYLKRGPAPPPRNRKKIKVINDYYSIDVCSQIIFALLTSKKKI